MPEVVNTSDMGGSSDPPITSIETIPPCGVCSGSRIRRPGYRGFYCSACSVRRTLDYNERNKDRVAKYTREWKKANYLYRIWISANYRCHNPNYQNYSDYGARGICVYPHWRKEKHLTKRENLDRYDKFKKYILNTIGERPTEGHSLDRRNNDAHYEPNNLRWATREEQANNTRRNVSVKLAVSDNTEIDYVDGRVTLIKLSEITSIDLRVVKYRYGDAKRLAAEDIWLYITDPFISGRCLRYKNADYNLRELVIISGIDKKTLRDRLTKSKWSVEKSMETPLSTKSQRRASKACLS